jgi:hypothetical protein
MITVVVSIVYDDDDDDDDDDNDYDDDDDDDNNKPVWPIWDVGALLSGVRRIHINHVLVHETLCFHIQNIIVNEPPRRPYL